MQIYTLCFVYNITITLLGYAINISGHFIILVGGGIFFFGGWWFGVDAASLNSATK
jgi:hypothetical protein